MPCTCLYRARWAGSAAPCTAVLRLRGTTIVLLTFTVNVHIFDGFNVVLLTTFMRTVVTFITVGTAGHGAPQPGVQHHRRPARAEALLAHDLLFMPHGFITGMPDRNVYEDEWCCITWRATPPSRAT